MNAEEYVVEYRDKTYVDLVDIDIVYDDYERYAYGSRFIEYIYITVLDNGILETLSGDPKEFRFIRKDGKDNE